jgi:hypothetical protein
MKMIILRIPRTTFLASLAAGLAAAGIVLCGEVAQAQPSISGIVLPNAPNNQNGYSVGALQFQGVVPPNVNQLSFQVSSGPGVTALTVQLSATTLPGVASSTLLTSASGLTIIGPNTDESVTAPLANDTVYTAVITATDSGGPSSSTVTFDTINPEYFTFEAEDFDFGGGQYLDSLPAGSFPNLDGYSCPQSTSPPCTNFDAIVGIDCNHPGDAGNNNYRANPLETESTSDTPRYQYASTGYPDFDIGYNNGGDWGNYTRHYPPGVYNIYLRGSGGNGAQANACEIGFVTSGSGTSNQTTSTMGEFSVAGLGWQSFTWCPAIDSNGNLVSWAAGGDQETLRFTVTGGNCNEGFYLLVPAVPTIAPNSTNVYKGGSATLSIFPYGLSTPTFQWQTDNGTGGATWANINGAVSTSYAVPTSSLSVQPYEYQVILTISSNSIPVNVTSAVVTLNILTPTKPVVVSDTYPSSATAPAGSASSFSASFTGPGPITYQWLVSSNLGVTFTALTGQTNTTLTVLDFTVFTNEYELEASNGIGVTYSTPATLITTPASSRPPVQLAGDLVAELRSADLVVGATTWTNRSGSAASVGNFQSAGQAVLTVSNNTINPGTPLWGAYNVNALYVNSINTAVQSALIAPAEISGDGPSSGEAWIYATGDSGNSSVIAYGVQGQSAHPEEDREMNWGTATGCFSGDFGSLDTHWKSPYPVTGSWFYLAWTWDGTNAIGYINGVQNVINTLSPSDSFEGYPLETVDTVIGIGAALNAGPNLGADNYTGWIASARLSSGVLTPNQISNNFAAGLLAEAPVTVYPPSASPTNDVTEGATITLTGSFTTNAALTYTYQWQWDDGSGGTTWTAISGATNATYLLNTTGLSPGDYEYELVLSNSIDSIEAVSSPITVGVFADTAPILVQSVTPSSLTQYVTQTNTLAASFTGQAPLTMQWQVSADDVNWSDTGTFTTNISIASEVPLTNWYRLAASNALGTNVTSAAEVIILPPLPFPPYAPLQTAGDLIMNLQQADLSASYNTWTNVTSNTNGVGNFSGLLIGGSNLNVTTGAAYLYNRVNALFVDENTANGVQSALLAPSEICGNNPVSAEAWVYAIAVNAQNSCAIAYGDQGQDAPPQADREFNYCTSGGGAVSGDFGSYDTAWATPPTAGVWHYLAWTYDGSTITCYEDGTNNTANSPSAPNVTPRTVVCVGGGIGQQTSGNPNLAVDAFQGYIGAARLESGVLSASQIATNYAAGLLGSIPAVVWPPSVTPAPLDNTVYQGDTVTLGVVARETTSFTYQWITDNGSDGASWADAPGASTGTNYVLSVSSLTSGKTYQYEIVLNNSTYSLSITSAPVELIVEAASAPTVEQQPTPASTNAYVGQNVTFTAAFTGNLPITNQWQFSTNGTSYTSIAGASNATLTLTDVQLTNAGSYRLTATNAQGSGTPSTAATLTVTQPPNTGWLFSSGSLTLTWPVGGTLLEATSLTGPWTVVTTTSPYVVTPASAGPALFFKVNYGP